MVIIPSDKKKEIDMYEPKHKLSDNTVRHITRLLMLLVICGFIACGKRDTPDSKTDREASSERTSQKGSVYYGESSHIGDLKNAVMYFMRNNQWEDAETTMRQIIYLNTKHGDTEALVSNYCVLGLTLQMQHKPKQALQAYQQELQIARTISPVDPASQCDAFLNMASAQIMLEELSEAKQSLDQAKAIATKHNLQSELKAVEEAFQYLEQL